MNPATHHPSPPSLTPAGPQSAIANRQSAIHPALGLHLSSFIPQPLQPVSDVPAYLATRHPQPDLAGEEHLLITLPVILQKETKASLRACKYAAGLVAREQWSVAKACAEALRVFRDWHWKQNTFRPKYDAWVRAQDWLVLVNRAKAPATWRDANTGLPDAFLAFVSTRFGLYARSRDGKRQAIYSVYRQWKTGKNPEGEEQPIPGYDGSSGTGVSPVRFRKPRTAAVCAAPAAALRQQPRFNATKGSSTRSESETHGSRLNRDATATTIWQNRDRENFPVGWSESNIRRQVRNFGKVAPAVLALLHESEAKARQLLPQVLGTRRGLRFLEKVTFDDVRTDWLIFNPKTGQAEEMWVLVARDEATAMVLGFVMLPSTERADGTATHISARQMKELAAYLLQTYPLPPYPVHWVVERGTATLAEGVQAALAELFGHRIMVHYTSMIGGLSPANYPEKKKGNARGKASHEAHNRLFHTQGAFIGGQTGANYELRPAELGARVKECREIWTGSQDLPAAIREEVKYPLPTPAKAREYFRQFCLEQNFRTAHKLEDFEEVLEVFEDGKWQPVSSVGVQPSGCARSVGVQPSGCVRSVGVQPSGCAPEQAEAWTPTSIHALQARSGTPTTGSASSNHESAEALPTAPDNRPSNGVGQTCRSAPPIENRQYRKRMEMPVERAARLIRHVEKWDRVSPDIVISFLEHNQRRVKIEPSGEIKFIHHDKLLIFRPPEGRVGQTCWSAKALAYHNTEAPEFLHVTTGDGRVLGTWALRGRGAYLDQDALAQAMRYTAAARAAAQDTARELAAPRRAQLTAMRAHNDGLVARASRPCDSETHRSRLNRDATNFVATAEAPAASEIRNLKFEIGNSIANALTAVRQTAAEMKLHPPAIPPVPDCTDELLARENSAPQTNFD